MNLKSFEKKIYLLIQFYLLFLETWYLSIVSVCVLYMKC